MEEKLKTFDRPCFSFTSEYCSGEPSLHNGGFLVNYYGNGDFIDSSLPNVCGPQTGPCALAVPYTKLQEGEEIDGVRFSFVQTVDTVTVKANGTVNLIPIYPEIEDTPSDWLPGVTGVAGGDGKEKIKLKVRLKPENIGGLPVEARVRVTVYDRTSYTGYAMNAQFNNEKDTQPDLLADPGQNPGWECTEDPSGELRCEKDMVSTDADTPVEFSSYDYAAYGKIRAEIVKLTGPNVEEFDLKDYPSRGRIEDRPAREYYTTIPIDRGEGTGQKGNKIADAGWTADSAHILDAATGDPSADIDDNPFGASDGDGLVTLEEYRGFKVNGAHRRTNPFHKDVFISSTLGVQYAHSALPTTTHRVYVGDFREDHSINWNAEGIAGHKNQCATIVNDAILLDENGEPTEEEYHWGMNFGSPPYPPCNSLGVDIYRVQIQLDAAIHGGDVSKLVKYTIGHECGHSVSFLDRVCECGGLFYSMMCTTTSIGPGGCLFTNTPSMYDAVEDLPKLDLW